MTNDAKKFAFLLLVGAVLGGVAGFAGLGWSAGLLGVVWGFYGTRILWPRRDA